MSFNNWGRTSRREPHPGPIGFQRLEPEHLGLPAKQRRAVPGIQRLGIGVAIGKSRGRAESLHNPSTGCPADRPRSSPSPPREEVVRRVPTPPMAARCRNCSVAWGRPFNPGNLRPRRQPIQHSRKTYPATQPGRGLHRAVAGGAAQLPGLIGSGHGTPCFETAACAGALTRISPHDLGRARLSVRRKNASLGEGNIADGAPQAPFNERLSSVVFCRAATAGEALLGVSFPRADERLSHLRHSLTSLA